MMMGSGAQTGLLKMTAGVSLGLKSVRCSNICNDLPSIVSKVNSFYIGYSTNDIFTTASNQDKFHLPEKLEENYNINTLFKLIYFTCIRWNDFKVMYIQDRPLVT